MSKHNITKAKAAVRNRQNTFDNAVMVLGFVEPAFTLPQLVHLYQVEDASGLSLTTWILFLLSSFVMITWGVRRKLKPIYIPQTAWLGLEIAIIYGIIKYS